MARRRRQRFVTLGPLAAVVVVDQATNDVLGLAVLIRSGSILLRRPRHPLFLVAGALMISGWGSNLLDRSGMHILTAPGSSRGAVDFIPVGTCHLHDRRGVSGPTWQRIGRT
jgi:hypothetical protein